MMVHQNAQLLVGPLYNNKNTPKYMKCMPLQIICRIKKFGSLMFKTGKEEEKKYINFNRELIN